MSLFFQRFGHWIPRLRVPRRRCFHIYGDDNAYRASHNARTKRWKENIVDPSLESIGFDWDGGHTLALEDRMEEMFQHVLALSGETEQDLIPDAQFEDIFKISSHPAKNIVMKMVMYDYEQYQSQAVIKTQKARKEKGISVPGSIV